MMQKTLKFDILKMKRRTSFYFIISIKCQIIFKIIISVSFAFQIRKKALSSVNILYYAKNGNEKLLWI